MSDEGGSPGEAEAAVSPGAGISVCGGHGVLWREGCWAEILRSGTCFGGLGGVPLVRVGKLGEKSGEVLVGLRCVPRPMLQKGSGVCPVEAHDPVVPCLCSWGMDKAGAAVGKYALPINIGEGFVAACKYQLVGSGVPGVQGDGFVVYRRPLGRLPRYGDAGGLGRLPLSRLQLVEIRLSAKA